VIILSGCNYTTSAVRLLMAECIIPQCRNILIIDTLTRKITNHAHGFRWFDCVYLLVHPDSIPSVAATGFAGNIYNLDISLSVKEIKNNLYLSYRQVLNTPHSPERIKISRSHILLIKFFAMGLNVRQVSQIMGVDEKKLYQQSGVISGLLGLKNLTHLRFWIHCNGIRVINKIFTT